MCGRFTQFSDPERLASTFSVPAFNVHLPGFRPRFNVAPSQQVAAVRLDRDGRRELINLKWGLLPFWSKEPKVAYSTISARAESVATKPAFRGPFRGRRCLIPADGFYEWKQEESGKQPYYIRPRSEAPFAFAGLWDVWRGGEQVIESCTIIVTCANVRMKDIHDRMPVILPPENQSPWIDPTTPPEVAQALLKPCAAETITCYRVDRRVNSPRNDDVSLIEPLS